LFFQFDLIASMPGYIFHPPTNSIRETKRLNYEGMQCVPTKELRNYMKGKKPHAPCFQQDWKAIGRCVKALQALCTLWFTSENTENQRSRVFHQ